MKFKLATAAAAVIMTASAAQAADLARKAPAAVDYVKVCDTYGAGFFYIPGSDTCLKISGYVRTQFGGGDGDSIGSGSNRAVVGSFSDARSSDSFKTRARFLLDVDARSQTEFGLLRSMAEVYWSVDTGSNASPTTSLDLAFIQWAGFTAGRAQSFFDFWTGNTLNLNGASEIAPDNKINLFAYTFAFGNGVTSTLSIEDPTSANNGSRRISDIGGTFTTADNYGGLKWPDLVANVAVSQGWGKAQIMGALHQNYSASNGGSDELGYAVAAGLQFNLPTLGAGDYVVVQANYGHGAVAFVAQSITGLPFDVTDFYGDDLSDAWSVAGGFHHVFSSKWAADVQGGYFKFEAPDSLSSAYDASLWAVGTSVSWTPVSNLIVRAGLEYEKIVDGYNYTNDTSTDGMDAWSVGLRIQRNF